MRTLITGANGLIGSHLAERLSAIGDDVCLISRKPNNLNNLINGKFKFKFGDITDSKFVFNTIEGFKPDRVFHLAAQSFPKISFTNASTTFRVNIEGTHNFLAAIEEHCPNALIFIFGSSSEYAQSINGEPIKEENTLEPNNIYGISKLANYYLSNFFYKTKKLNLIYIRPFFIIGPRKNGDVSSDFAKSIVKIERNISKILLHGNLNVYRDFLDVEDCINALLILCKKGKAGQVYNICSGESIKINYLLSEFCKISKFNIKTEVNESFYRPADEIFRIGDPTKLKLLGWSKNIPLKQTVEKILNYWRNYY